MPAIFFARQVDGVRSLPPRASADAIQDAARVAAKTEVGCTQPGIVVNHPEHRVDAHDGSGRSCTGQREGTRRTARGRRSPGTGQQGRAPGAELVQQNQAVSHASGGAVEQAVSRPYISR